MNPLFRMALLKGSLTSVRLHLQRGAPVNRPDEKGLTPLMLAAAAGRTEVCRLLLEEGADAGADQSGCTAADLAMHSGHAELARVLRAPLACVAVSSVAVSQNARAEPDRNKGSDWEAEDVFVVAQSDAIVFGRLIDTQTAISAAKAVNPDSDWQDLTIDLPAIVPLPKSDASARALRMIETALRDPQFGWSNLAKVAARFPGLEALLEDLGIATSATYFERALLGDSEPSGVISDEAFAAEIAEAVEALRVWRPATELYQLELSRLPNPDRSAEQSMFGALRDAKRQMFGALLRSLPLAGHVLGEAEANDLDPAELHSKYPAEEHSRADFDQVDQSLAQVLKAVRDGMQKADPNDLIDLDVDTDLIAAFEAALAGCPAAGNLGTELRTATAKYLGIRDRVIEANLPLVIRYAGRSLRPGVLLEDLVQDGSIGLMRAVERFDVSRGHRFMTYAIWWIRQACGRTAEDHARTIRIPVHVAEQVQRVARARNQLKVALRRSPHAEELGAAIDVSSRKAAMLDRLRHRAISIESAEAKTIVSLMTDKGASTPFEAAAAAECKRTISEVLGTLSEKQERIIRSRFGIGAAEDQTLEEVGQLMSVTRERIRQIEAMAIRALKKPGPRKRRLRALL